MLKYAAEFIGTFIFLSVILNAVAKGSSLAGYAPLAIGLALAVAIQFGGAISGGHYNPAVSVMFALKNELAVEELLPYITAQVLGAVAAKYFYDLSVMTPMV
jgi:glycerol uptake facilitator-like aquaporin